MAEALNSTLRGYRAPLKVISREMNTRIALIINWGQDTDHYKLKLVIFLNVYAYEAIYLVTTSNFLNFLR